MRADRICSTIGASSPSGSCFRSGGLETPHAATEKLLPLFRSLRGYQATYLPGDMVAGLTLAAIAIPEQMATARLGGFSPQIGFFAFIAGSFGFAILGSNRFLSCGADSTITPIFAGGVAALPVPGPPDDPAAAIRLAAIGGGRRVV